MTLSLDQTSVTDSLVVSIELTLESFLFRIFWQDHLEAVTEVMITGTPVLSRGVGETGQYFRARGRCQTDGFLGVGGPQVTGSWSNNLGGCEIEQRSDRLVPSKS